MTDIFTILTERHSTHGDIAVNSDITFKMFDVIDPYLKNKNNIIRLKVFMILHKLSRIAAGDETFNDHWDDICGYAKVKSNLTNKNDDNCNGA